MKKTIILLVIIVFVTLLTGAQTTKAIHPDTPIYAQADFDSDILFKIPRNAQVIVLEQPTTINNIDWIKVQYGSYYGYVNNADLYQTEEEVTYSLSYIKATSTKMGQPIIIYSANSIQSQVVDTVKDGAKLIKINSDVDYGNFYEIRYNDKRAFIEKSHATTSLTYNQKTALIIGSAALAVIISMFVLIKFIKKSRRKSNN